MLRTPRYLPQAVAYVQTHWAEPVQVRDLAHRMHVSQATLTTAFKRATGTTPYQYLTQLRLTWAAEQLRTTDARIVSIAHQSGYQDHSHFSQAFKRAYGVPPEVYRAQGPPPGDTLALVGALWAQVGPDVQAQVLRLLQQAVPTPPARAEDVDA